MRKFAGLSDQALIQEYRDAAVRHGAANESGKASAGNKDADLMLAIYKEFLRRGLQSQICLLPLLEDVDPSVRGWAATHALNFTAPAAMRVLEALSTESSLLSFGAEMALKEWKKDKLRVS